MVGPYTLVNLRAGYNDWNDNDKGGNAVSVFMLSKTGLKNVRKGTRLEVECWDE